MNTRLVNIGTNITVADKFLDKSLSLAGVQSLMECMVEPKCTLCQINKECTAPVPAVGNVDSDVVVIGRNPGVNEDKLGLPFIGRGGNLLNDFLGWAGLSRDRVYITNLVKCYTRENRPPLYHELETCVNSWLVKEFQYLKPKLILALGVEACYFMTQGQFKNNRGKRFVYDKNSEFLSGVSVIPCTHPGAGLRSKQHKENMQEEAKYVKATCQELGIL